MATFGQKIWPWTILKILIRSKKLTPKLLFSLWILEELLFFCRIVYCGLWCQNDPLVTNENHVMLCNCLFAQEQYIVVSCTTSVPLAGSAMFISTHFGRIFSKVTKFWENHTHGYGMKCIVHQIVKSFENILSLKAILAYLCIEIYEIYEYISWLTCAHSVEPEVAARFT